MGQDFQQPYVTEQAPVAIDEWCHRLVRTRHNCDCVGQDSVRLDRAQEWMQAQFVSNSDGAIAWPIGSDQLPTLTSELQSDPAVQSYLFNSLTSQQQAAIIAAGAGNIINAGANNIINAGAYNFDNVSRGLGNFVYPNGSIINAESGNIIATGSGNIINAGANNIINSGSGNLVQLGPGAYVIAAGAGN